MWFVSLYIHTVQIGDWKEDNITTWVYREYSGTVCHIHWQNQRECDDVMMKNNGRTQADRCHCCASGWSKYLEELESQLRMIRMLILTYLSSVPHVEYGYIQSVHADTIARLWRCDLETRSCLQLQTSISMNKEVRSEGQDVMYCVIKLFIAVYVILWVLYSEYIPTIVIFTMIYTIDTGVWPVIFTTIHIKNTRESHSWYKRFSDYFATFGINPHKQITRPNPQYNEFITVYCLSLHKYTAIILHIRYNVLLWMIQTLSINEQYIT